MKTISRFIILIIIILNSTESFARKYITLEKAKDWFAKNTNKCVFAAVKTYRGKTKSDQEVLDMIGAKPNDVELFTYPNVRTPSLCIFNGIIGKGAAEESGCVLGRYLLDHDEYESIRYTNSLQFAKAILPGKCDLNSVKKLLTTFKFNSFVSIGPYPSESEVWKNFNDGLTGPLAADVHILADQFNIKVELEVELKKIKDKQELENIRQKEILHQKKMEQQESDKKKLIKSKKQEKLWE